MYKSKRQKNKSFDWYGLSQRFSIRKYHFGAASVLLGTALILGAAQTTAKAEEATTENKTEAVTPTSKDAEAAATPANVTLPATEATTGAPVLDKKELSEEEIAKLAAEVSKKDEKASETATAEKTEVSDKEKATLTAPSTDKKVDKTVDEKADKKDEKKAENPITATKKILEQLTSEAEVLNTTAANYAEKKVEDKSSKEAIAAAVAAAKVEITASKKVLNEKDVTAEQLNLQLQRISSAIEAVYAEMKRAGHVGKVEAVLADPAGSTVAITNPINKVVVNNVGDITEEEARAIEKEIRTANPTLTAEDKIEVKRKGNTGLAVATVTLANGRVDQNGNTTHGFAIGDVAYGSAGEKNFSQLRESINWFDFATASITYADGTKVGPVEYVNNPAMVDFTSSKGRRERGRFTMVRKVLESTTHPELVGKKTNDPAFLESGLAKYTLWKTYDHVKHEVQQGLSEGRFNNEIFEVLQEGMRFNVPTKVKGYTLSATVSSLSRKKVTTETYTLNKANGEPENINRSPVDGVVQREDVIVTRQDPNWSHLRLAGFEAKYKDSNGVTRERLTAFSSAYDGGNVGVKFQLSATYNGRPVAVNAIAADSEDLSVAEFTQFESDGTPWEEFMRLNKNKTNSKGLFPNREGNGNFLSTFDRKTNAPLSTGYKLSEWTNKTETGYGSQLFGPFDSGVNNGYDLPIGLTQNVENLGVYINANGSQSATIGFVIYDGGDAPASYGSAQHIIGNFNKEKDGKQVTATQPYLGDVPADSDFRTTIAEPNGAWVLDDLVNSEDYKEISLVSGSTQVTNSKGQSGTYLLDGKNPVIHMSDGTQVAIKNGEILSTANTLPGGDNLPIKGLYNQATRGLGVGNLPDEGEGQLLDPAAATKYTLRHASENEYILKGVKVNRGVNNDVAYVRGWVDFNGNGRFDLYESSELVTANADGTYDITFKNTPQLLNTSVDNLGVRLRVSVDKNDLRLPTGLASSGEVEDFVANVIHPPRGTRHETKDFQGKKQEVNFPTNAMFKASGKTIESNYKQWAEIDNNTAPKMVLNDTVVKSEELTGKTVEVKDHLSQTIYNGTEVVVKDARGNTLGTAVKVTNKLTGKTEYYLSEYTEYDTAGNKVGVYKLNEGSAEGKNTTQGSLSFTKISFQPEAGFVGTAKGVAIRAWDDNGSHTGWEATEDTIKESLTSTTLAEKDKILENVNNGNNGAKSMDTSYIPTVIDVRPVGEDTTTEDVQGKPQSSNPSIPTKGTVETITNESVETSKRVDILNTSEKPTFATRKETPGKLYTEDTTVDKETTLTLTDGTTVTYKPSDKIPAGTTIANTGDVNVTGTGNVSVNNIRLVSGTLIPAGAKPQSNHPAPVEVKVTLANGTEQTIPAGETIPAGATINTPFTNSANNTFDNVTYNTGQTIPRETGNKISRLANETSADQLVSKGESVTLNGTTYSANKDVIPKGTRTAATYEDLMNVTLPNAVHLDPETGEVTTVPRSYTKVTDTEIVIENEGTYTLNQDTGEIKFTPHPKFVGTGTGVVKQQPDIDYNDKVAGDSVTSKYGTDYGKAKYIPIVKPQSKESITRTIHYVYENDNDNPASQDSYKDNDPIVAIDNTPVTRTQTIDYTREYKIFSEAGATATDLVTANQVTDATGHVYKVGDTIPAGTQFNQGSIIIGKWTASSDENSKFKEIISPTVKGYTAEVVTADFTPRADGKMGHIHNGKQRVGLYTPVADNTKDVGAYEPLVSEVRSDDKDDFDMYVVYKADTQKAKVTYIDLDATGDARILEVQNANPAPATGADAKTTYGVTTLQGKSHTKIPYTTAETIKKYEDLGYELVTDDFTNNTQGNPVEGGRKFDDDKEVDQAFNVYLRHKKVEVSDSETQEVTRTINYKYAATTDVPADKRNTTAAPSVVERLTYKRDRTIDLVLAAKAYPTEYATYKAEAAKGTDAEKTARTVLLDHVASKAAEATATADQKAIITYGQWTPKAGNATGITLTSEEVAKDNKFNNVPSPTVAGYTPDKVAVDATAEIDAEAADYTVEVLYTPEKQRATVKFVESDANGVVKTVSNGVDVALADALTETGASGTNFTTLNQAKVDEVIKNLEAKGYTLVSDGFKAATTNTEFDTDKAIDQEFVVKLTPKVVEVPSFDPTKPKSADNPKPEPGQPVDPTKPDGPKWPASVKDLKNTDTVKRTVKYVFENGAPVIDPTTGNQKVVEQEVKFTRTSSVNLVTGEITYGEWTAAQELPAVTSPTETDIPAVTNHIPSTKTVPAVTVQAEGEDLTETVVYRKIDSITVQPNDPTPTKDTPIDPNNPDGPKWTEELIKKLEDARKEEVNRTITYKYSDVESELKPADTAKKGADVASEFTTKVEFKRAITVDPVTGDFTYGPWKATNDDTTLEGKSELPVVTGYVATGDVDSSKKDVTDVNATDKDITEKVVYKAVGNYVPVIPEGITPPANVNVDPKPYTNDPQDGSKVKDPDPTNPVVPGTTTPIVPQIPGTTPVGPDGKPLKPVDPNDPSKGYIPPTPTDPTKDTSIIYVKDGTQIAVTKFVDVDGNGLEPSVVDTGDTGKAFTKDADVTAAINKILARGYEKVANVNAGEKDYPSTDAEKVFDADAKTNQEFTVTFKPIVKEVPVNPATPGTKPQPGQPVDPSNPDGPKWPSSVKDLKNSDTVKRTIKYVYEDGTPVIDPATGAQKVVEQTAEFTRTANVNLVTGDITYGDWTPAKELAAVASPTATDIPAVANYIASTATVPSVTVAAEADDITETVVYRQAKPVTITPTDEVPNDDPSTPVDPNNPIQPGKPIDPNNPDGPKWTKDLIDKLRDARSETVTRTITYKYSDVTSELKAEDAAKAGQLAADTVTNTVTFKRPVTIDPITKEFTYGDWVATNGTTLAGKADLPVVAGYVATGDVEASKKDVEVKATDKDITENVVYKTVGKYVPVIPDGITPPANTNVDPKPYNNDPQDGSKVKDPDPTNPVVPGTTTPIVPQIPGTTPVGPDGKPLKPVDSNDLSKGYVPPTPTDPTKDTSIIYVKDGSQVAVVHFVDEKGNSVNESVVETGDTGKEISKSNVDAVKAKLEAKGYTVVEPTDALYTTDKEGFYKEATRTFDAVSDKSTGAAGEKVPSQQYYVIVKAKDLPVDPTKPLDPNNNPVDPTNPTPENPTKPRDPETPVTPKPEDKVPNDPKGRTYGELGLVEQVTRTINYVKNDGSKAAEPVKETLTFTRKAKINAVTGEVTYLDNDGNATTKEAAPWTPVNGDKFAEKVSPSVTNYTPTVEKVAEKTGVTATDKDIVETVVYNPSTTNVDPNPVTPGENPDPNKVVENDPKKRTLKELGLIEEVTHTVHYKLEDGSDAGIADNVQKVTFTRTAKIDSVTGATLEYGKWTPETKEFTAVTTPAKDGYIASAKTSTANANVGATDKDTEETIIYRKLGSYVPVVPAGVTPPADFDKTPKPYPNATPEDPTKPGTPTTTTIPEIPGTTPVGPDGTPLTKNPNGGYDLPPVPTDPTQNTTITYVKDGSQVAVVHFVDEKGNSVNESVVETGDTGKEISKSNVDAVKAKLEAKGYTVVEPTDALYTTDKEGFYKEATRTFDAVSDKSTGAAGEKVPSQQYYVIVKAKDLPVDPTKPLDPNNNPVDPTNPTPENPTKPRDPETPVTPKPEDKVPNDPKGRTYGELGLVEQVTRTINYVKNDGSKAAEPVKETLTFTRKAKINAVTGEVTYLDNDGNATTKEAAPWTPVNNDTTFDKVTSPSVPDYTPTKAEVPAKENVTATDEDIVETVVYNPTKVTVTPNNPNVDPEKPLNPNDPNGLKYKDLKLTEEVKRTITYAYADDVADTSKRGTDAAPKHETTVSFTRTATVNQATGEVTYGDWTAVNNDTTLEGKTELPVIPGYVATGDVESVKKDVANVSATDKDIVEKVVYKDLGKYVPVVPDGTTPPTITDPKYPNNPTDPTKPGEPTTTIPNVPGLTPLDPSTGKPLEPKDPNDLTKGYKPPVPQDPSKDTNIVYVADGSQVTVVHFVDEDGNAVHTSFVEAGDAGAKFTKAGEVTKVVEELKAAGYTVVPNKAGQAEYPGEAGVFDSVDDKGKDGVSQVYYVTVAKTVPVTPTTPQNPNEDPKNPKPGDPIDPNKPDGPKWTEDALNKLNNIKSVTRTITYVKDGTDEEVSTTEAPKVTNKVSFTRTAIVNPKDGSVVGYDTNGDGKVDLPATDTTNGWTAAGTAKFAEVKSPVVKGYVVKPNQDTQGDLVEADGSKVKASATDLTVDSANQDLKVRYVPVGSWTPKVPDGDTPIDPIPYPNDPKDPGKVVDPNKPTDPNDPNKPSVPVVPHIPGTTPKDPNGNPLKPVDPEDPSKGYVPPTPTTPTENTVIEYVKDDQKAVTKFVDPSGNPIPGVNNIEETGKSGEPLTKATEVTNEIAKLIAKGYELVSNNYGKDNNGNFDKDSGKDQEYTVVLTPHVEPIKPFDPANPNDPNKPKPGTPIDPNNPDGPKWTEELIKSLETTKHVTRTISYVDKDGNKVEYTDKDGNKSTADVTDKVTFTREAKINVVTGTIEYGKWTPVNNDTTFDKVTSPVVPGYVLKDPAQKEVAETTGLTENSKDENIKVVYVPVGRLVPKVPEGVTPPTPTPYDNDPQDPGKVVPPSPTKPTDPQDPNSPKVPVIPHIPGTTPKVPQDPTKPVDPNTNPLVPLKPVDPKDPSKGYEVPPVPTDPGTDTPIVYENDKQKAITNFVDNNGKVVSDPVVDQGDSGSKFTKSGDVESKIKELVKKGYVVTSNDYPSADTDRVFDNDKDKDQIFNVKVTPLIVPTDPNSPDQPQVPTDPTKPVGPNNPLKPVTPSTPEPGKPVFPEDPNSPVWPETVKDMVTETTATRTITYVDRNGKEVAATHTETIKFKRTAKVNLVTGDITYGEWIVVGNDTILDGNKLPKVDGYIARGGYIESSQKDIKATAGVNITERVVYDKLGSWIPKLPEGQTQVPPTPYPNDPTDPTKPGTDRPRVPYVPGFIPVDPNGNPLKPVDPNDPTKGYEVPVVPADPTKDTPIKYIPVPTPNNGGGNNGGGGGNTPTPQPQPNPTPQPEPSPAPNPVPVTPETPEQPVVPVAPEQPAEPATPQYMDGQRELPNTGTEAHSSLAALGLLGALSGFGLIARKKRKDEE